MNMRDAKAGDIIWIMNIGSFNTAVVKKVEDDAVTLWRPYGHISDFETTAGVICYVGIEEFRVPRDYEIPSYELLERTNPK